MTADAVRLDDIHDWAPAGSCESLHILRLDLIHPVVSGNKWFKLEPALKAAREAGFGEILSFGGGYSNHLVALAYAAREAGLGSLGMVRGHYNAPTPSLEACAAFGMKLLFLRGSDYVRLKNGTDPELARQFPAHWILPEGGADASGISGAAAISAFIPSDTTDVCLAVGTGATLAGLDLGLPIEIALHGYCVAKDCDGAKALIHDSASSQRVRWHEVEDPRFGRWRPGLLTFMRQFWEHTSIRLDVVYTSKMMHALQTQLLQGSFAGRRVVCIHTGGLQGNPAGLFHASGEQKPLILT